MAVEVAGKATLIDSFKLKSKDQYQNMPQFKKARRVKSNSAKGDYKLFYVWDTQKGDLVRKRTFWL
ncbi:hypothetical protein GCM10022393_00610 [Aquimarina addita]|uniref:Uncharacterized protein n=1 Tax=Aquimarina addita TaxID=870485 RepID=A0ABP7X727_9FLAO